MIVKSKAICNLVKRLKGITLLNCFFGLLFVMFILSCEELKRSDKVDVKEFIAKNNIALEAVLAHYEKKPSDSIKLKAASYLITNMLPFGNYKNSAIYDTICNKVSKEYKSYKRDNSNAVLYDITEHSVIYFNQIKASLENKLEAESVNWKKDIKTLSPEFLINNINLAFLAYKNSPLKLCKTQEDFFKYVLPYRVGQEPLKIGKRKELYEKYKWVQDSLKTQPVDSIVKGIYEDLQYAAVWGKYNPFLHTPSLDQIEKTRFASCDALSNYIVSVLRAVGIPSGIDFVPRFGNSHKAAGHSWVFYLNEDGFKSIDIGTEHFNILNDIYKISSIPKVYRKSFDGVEDVTQLYRKTYNFDVPIIWNKEKVTEDNVFISVFDGKRGWDKIQEASGITKATVNFKNIGNNIIYLPIVTENGHIYPINYPFELKQDGTLRFFNSNKTKKIKEAILTRKFAPFLVRNRKEKMHWIQSLNGCILQGSNSNKDNAEYEDLFVLKNFNSFNAISFSLEKKTCYKFFRLKGPDNQRVNLAKFKLLDVNGTPILNWEKVSMKNDADNKIKRIISTDENLDQLLSFIDKKGLQIDITFKERTCIGGFLIQARNDDNNVAIGEHYELFYWDKNWKSLGKKIAKDTLLKYSNLPSNALFLLKNHTKGVEETIFTINNNRKQFWIGSSEYEKMTLYSK